MNKFLSIAGLMALGLVTNASAALVIAPIDTVDYLTVAAAVVTAAGVFFGVKKAIALVR